MKISFISTQSCVSVEGSFGELCQFFDIYQTSLWADWATSQNDAARKQFLIALPHMRRGKSSYFAKGAQHVRAIRAACGVCDLKSPV